MSFQLPDDTGRFPTRRPRGNSRRPGASDVEADAAGSGAQADLTHAIRDSDGVPIGAADLAADKRASGGRPDQLE